MEAMKKYDWPGNIRELANSIERAIIFCDGETIQLGDLPKDIVDSTR
jgi:DNA-binding NtrC family response regulator